MFPFMTAAGWIKRPGPEFDDALRSPATSITVGSITWQSREGNPTDKGAMFRVDEDGFGLNSLGMPNEGAERYREMLSAMVARAHGVNKKLRVNVAGFSPYEYARLTELCLQAEVDEIEHNWGCPNVWGEDGQKPITSFSIEAMAAVLEATRQEVGAAPLAVKLSPYSNPAELSAVAEFLGAQETVVEVVTSNTFPNALDYTDDGELAIPFGEGFAGYSGRAMRNIALGQVKQFRMKLPTHQRVIGVGGITTGRDIWKFINRAGADGVQVGTALFARSVPGAGRILSDMLEEYAKLIG